MAWSVEPFAMLSVPPSTPVPLLVSVAGDGEGLAGRVISTTVVNHRPAV